MIRGIAYIAAIALAYMFRLAALGVFALLAVSIWNAVLPHVWGFITIEPGLAVAVVFLLAALVKICLRSIVNQKEQAVGSFRRS
jgi:hypothetical protein